MPWLREELISFKVGVFSLQNLFALEEIEGIFPGGRMHELGSGLRGSGSYLDLPRPVIALLLHYCVTYRVTGAGHCITLCIVAAGHYRFHRGY